MDEARVNLGATTPDDSLLHIDIDPQHGGKVGPLKLKAKETWTYESGGGGLHLIYRIPAGVQISHDDELLGEGIDVLHSGYYGVIPPLIYPKTASPYTWVEGSCSPLECVLAEAPAHIFERLTSPRVPVKVELDLSDGEVTGEGKLIVLQEVKRSAQRVSQTARGGWHNVVVNQTAYLKGYVLSWIYR